MMMGKINGQLGPENEYYETNLPKRLMKSS